jgi:glycosyltransferase involved in cell wall biosynthesis
MKSSGSTTRHALLYLGSKGGGVWLTESLCRTGLFDTVFVSDSWNLKSEVNSVTLANFSRYPRLLVYIKLFLGIGKRGAVVRALREVSSRNISKVVITMSHPWDSVISKRLREQGVTVYRVMHDARRHPGDYWPTNRRIRKLLNQGEISIFLNNTVAQLAQRESPRARILTIDLLSILRLTDVAIKTNLVPKSYLLILGRIKKYKGIQEFIEVWNLAIQSENPDIKNLDLIIAGKGWKSFFSQIRYTNLIRIDKWLSNNEMIELISHSMAVVLPYTEASQSGILEMVDLLGHPVIYRSLPSINEQITLLSIASIAFKYDDPHSLTSAIANLRKMGKVSFDTMTKSRELRMRKAICELEKLLAN